MQASVFTVLYILFFTASFLLRRKIRSKTLSAKKISGKVSYRGMSTYFFYVYLLILFGSFAEYFIMRKAPNMYVTSIGLILYVSGIAGRQWAWRSLGEYWSIHIEIREGHRIIRNGPYRYIRHPNCMFHIFELLGIVLIPNSYLSMTAFFAMYLPLWIYRTMAEEHIMIRELGNAYEEYMDSVPGFIPRFPAKGAN